MASIRPADLSEWVGVRDRIRQLEAINLPSVKAIDESKLAHAEREVQALRAEVAEKQKKAAKEGKDVHRIEKKGLIHLAAKMGGKLEEKEEKEHREAAEADADLEKAKASLAAHEAGLGRITADLSRVNADEASLRSLHDQQNALLERIFWGPSGAGDQAEKTLQGEVAALLPSFEGLQRQAQAHNEANDHMLKAVQMCGSSVQDLRQAASLCQSDTVMDIGLRNGGMVGDVADIRKQQDLRQAGALLQGAAQEVDAARAFVPQIQPIDPDLVRAMGGIMDIVFDNVFTDVALGAQVRNSLQRAEATYVNLQQGQEWVAGIKRQSDEQFYGVKAIYDAKVYELKQHRWMLIEAAANSAAPPN